MSTASTSRFAVQFHTRSIDRSPGRWNPFACRNEHRARVSHDACMNSSCGNRHHRQISVIWTEERNHDAPYRRCRRRVGNRGHVIAYAGPRFTFGDAGHQVALIGGPAFCEACGSTGQIAKAGGPKRIAFMGETAADGDIVLCRCATPPRIIAVLSGNSWCDDEAETEGVVSSGSNPQRNTAAVAAGAYDDAFAPSETAHCRIIRTSSKHRTGVFTRVDSMPPDTCRVFIRAMRARTRSIGATKRSHD